MAKPSPMNAGNGEYSYAKNSSFQKFSFDSTKDAIKEAISESFDVEKQLIMSTAGNSSCTLRIADLGCSCGPNTFFAMQTIIEAVKSKYNENSQELEFQVFFNDVNGNDFNTLFASLPKYWDRKHHAAGVAGSFHDRLFPSSSIHVFHSFLAIHWLSKVPEELLIRDSPAWNRGKIHYFGSSSDAVFNAYAAQFEKDVDAFLKARADEIVPGGIVIIYTLGTVDETTPSGIGMMPVFLGSILQEMVQEGLISQDQVDTFNFPTMHPSVKQMTRLVEKNGCFNIEKMELRNPLANTKIDSGFLESRIMSARAVSEGTFVHHFGNETVYEMFKRAFKQKQKLSDLMESSGNEGDELFAVLKRK